jgi:hypothetical protein
VKWRVLAKGLAAVTAALLMIGMIELSSLAAERRAARVARHALFTDALEPELPSVSEVEPTEPVATPALAR